LAAISSGMGMGSICICHRFERLSLLA